MALIYVILYDPLCAPCDSPGGGDVRRMVRPLASLASPKS